MADATLGGPGIVAVGHGARGGEIWTTADGIAWQRLPPALTFEGVGIQRIVTWRGALVAAGWSGRHMALWTSTDGTSWTLVPDRAELVFPGDWTADMGGVIERLSVEGDELVAVVRAGCECIFYGGRLLVWRTTDLASWQRTESAWDLQLVMPPPTAGGRGLLRLSRILRAGPEGDGWHATIETSVDGVRWRRVFTGPAESYPYDLYGVLQYGDGLIAYGEYRGGPLIVKSADGLNWTTVSWDFANGDFNPRRLLDLDGRLVLLGDRDRTAATFVSPPLPAPIVAARPSEPPGGLLVVGGQWRAEPQLPAPVRDATAVALPDGRIALIGGGSEYNEWSGDVVLYDPVDGSSTALPALPVAVENMPAVALPNGELLVFMRRASYSLAPGAAGWRARSPIPGAYLAHFIGASAALGDDGLVYLAAGGRRIYVYDPARDAWRASLRVPVATGAAAVVAADGAILVVTAVRVWIYSLADAAWTPGPARLRASFGTVGAHLLADGRLVVLTRDVLLGECSFANVKLTVEVLDAARTRWALGPMRPSIMAAAAAVSGDRVFVLGGALRTITADCGWSGTGTIAGVWSLELTP